MYRYALYGMIPYFFANNNVNYIYARWIPIHLRDMMVLEEQHPDEASEFHKGNFVIHKSRRDFSAMAIDLEHEQNNAVIKGDGVLLAWQKTLLHFEDGWWQVQKWVAC